MKVSPLSSLMLWVIILVAALGSCSGVAAAEPAASPAATNSVAAPHQAPEWLTFGLHRIEALDSVHIAGIPSWQYLASLIYIFLAFAASGLVDHAVGNRLAAWAKRTKSSYDDIALSLVRAPVRWITLVALLYAGVRVYRWPAFFEETFAKALAIAVGAVMTFTAVRAIDLLVGFWQSRNKESEIGIELFPLVRKSLKVFVVIVAVLVTSQNVGLNVTGLIASLSIGGLAVGLAAQDTLSNVFGAVSILTDRPFRVGQLITVGNVTGFVEAIGFRSTRMRNLDGHLVSIPNKEVGNATITNITERATIRTVMNIGLTYGATPQQIDQASEILASVFKEHEMTKDVWISFNKFADWSLNIQVVHWWNGTDYKEYLDGMHELNREIKKRFDEANLDFAFPTQTVFFEAAANSLNGAHTPLTEKGLSNAHTTES